MFKKYRHVERIGNVAVEEIAQGECYIFPKLDGSNGVVWFDNGLQFGSRKRHLTEGHDNREFKEMLRDDPNLKSFFEEYPNHILYGEWLVPHNFKEYRKDAWRKFYIFDVRYEDDYLHYNEYSEMLDKHQLEYIPFLAVVSYSDVSLFNNWVKQNHYLIEKPDIYGEGIVIKNYEYRHRGKQVWAKITAEGIKDRKLELNVKDSEIEFKIVEEFCTEELIKKEFYKIKNEHGWDSHRIPMLLGIVKYTFIKEEAWNFIKKYKSPTIDFKKLNKFLDIKTKNTLNYILTGLVK